MLLRPVNFTGYRLIRRILPTGAMSCLFVSFWNDSGLFWDLTSLFFSNSLEKLMKVEIVGYIKPKLIVNTLFYGHRSLIRNTNCCDRGNKNIQT